MSSEEPVAGPPDSIGPTGPTGPTGARPRPPWAEFQQALTDAGYRPSRRWGQNLLRDGNMARAIARDAQVGAEDFVLEVGPGCGFLTLHLLDFGVRLLGVDIDPRLLAVARELLPASAHLELLQCDVLAGKHQLAPEVLERLPAAGPWHLVSNLPYSIGTSVMIVLARLANPPTSMTVLIQRELAERIASPPGTKSWGPASIRLQAGYEVELLRGVPRDLFWPRPKVESQVVRLCARADGLRATADLDALVDGLFRGRRKTLGRLLADLLGDRAAALGLLESHGLPPATRPEELSLERIAALASDPSWTGRPGSSGRSRAR